jgi:predicted Zn-dependent peptidase
MADILRMYINQGFDPTESAKRNEALLAATPMDLQRFAQQYYTPDALLEVVAGGVA